MSMPAMVVGGAVILVVVVPPKMSPPPSPLPTVISVVVVVVDDKNAVDVLVVVESKLKLPTSFGGPVVGITTFAQGPQVAQTDHPHFTNQGWPFMSHSARHSRGCSVVVVVTGPNVVVNVLVSVVLVFVVVVQTSRSDKDGVHGSTLLQ
mmetsp:Transcript_88767/g.248407  ORF Transcript_88767/g.248407 Transcript_88767/m.248407 type:complete len:149 (+) Transcript_88767:1105-1551(+)